MVTGLFKSSFLHLAIILIFMYGAEIFKRNKRFEIIEVPLDIIEISEKTVTKENTPKAKTRPKKLQTYTPPQVLSRPKSPEFSNKKKIEKEKKNDQDKMKKKK